MTNQNRTCDRPAPIEGADACPVSSPRELLTPLEEQLLIAGLIAATGQIDPDAIENLLNSACYARMSIITLGLAMEGQVVPIGFDEFGRVRWRRAEECLRPEQVRELRQSLAQVKARSPEVRRRTLLTILAQCGDTPMASAEVEAIVAWAEEIRRMGEDMEGVLRGWLVPFIAPNGAIGIDRIERLAPHVREIYRRQRAELERQAGA